MSEMSELYKVPAPEEVDELLRGDFGVDESPEVLEIGDRTNYEDSISVISHLIDSHLEISISVDFAKAILEEMTDMGWHLCKIAPLPPEDFSTGGNSKVMEVDDHGFEDYRTLEGQEQVYRERVQRLNMEHAQQLNEIANLITELYLDLEYIKRVAKMLIQFAASQSPEALRTVASLIDYQAAASLAQIQDHNETAHYPNVLIHNHERSTT